MGVGENIRSARQRAQLTQKQLGKLCGIAEPTIRRYELNKLNPKFDTIGYWTERFQRGLSAFLQSINRADSDAASFDFESAVEIAEGCVGFSFEDACQIASELGTTVDDLIAAGAKEITEEDQKIRTADRTPDSSE